MTSCEFLVPRHMLLCWCVQVEDVKRNAKVHGDAGKLLVHMDTSPDETDVDLVCRSVVSLCKALIMFVRLY